MSSHILANEGSQQPAQAAIAIPQSPDLHDEPKAAGKMSQKPHLIQERARTSNITPADNIVEDFRLFVTFVFGVSIFGAATFAVIVGQMTDPVELSAPDAPTFTLSTVRTFLAMAWLCFILSLALAGYSSSGLLLARKRAYLASDENWAEKWEPFGVLSSTFLHLLLVVAFMFLSLSIVPYASAVGWAAVGFTSLATVFVLCLCTYQIWYISPD